MRAVDTNVIIRFLLVDNPEQGAAAGKLIAENDIWVSRTVVLETVWVLESRYGFAIDQICGAFRSLLALPNVFFEDSYVLNVTLDLVREGVDFADAFHLMATPPGVTFMTFDKTLIRRARRAGIYHLSAIE